MVTMVYPQLNVFAEKIILVVTNVKLMSKAIETHVAKHKQEVKDPKEAEAI